MRMESYGSMIRRERMRTRRTLKEVADHVGVSVGFLCDVEFGRRNPFSPERTRMIAQLLELPDGGDELVGLAAEMRGGIEMPMPSEAREMLVALERSIASQSLDSSQVGQILDILNGKNAR